MVVGRQEPESFLEGQFILLYVLRRQFAPIAADVPLDRPKDELSELFIICYPIIDPARPDQGSQLEPTWYYL